MSGSANIRRVEVGPIWNHADANKKANAYLERHPWVEWTGHWTTTVPNEMSVIEIRNRTSLTGFVRGENRDVEMGPIWNHQDAWSKAEAFVEEHPFLEWNGQWATTVISGRRTSVIGVRLREQSQSDPAGAAGAAPAAISITPTEVIVAHLVQMGYPEDQALAALLDADENLEQALDTLSNQTVQDGAHTDSPDLSGGAFAAPSTPPAASSSPSSEEGAGDKCVVCLERPINCTLVPCGHLCCCFDLCAAVVEQCPICRADIQQRIKTYHHGSS
ncbi:unnamed protein product [Ectocarpus sp. 12 AP-2014]